MYRSIFWPRPQYNFIVIIVKQEIMSTLSDHVKKAGRFIVTSLSCSEVINDDKGSALSSF